MNLVAVPGPEFDQMNDGPEMNVPCGEMAAESVLCFEHLTDRGIRYCHWKSNEHLRAGLDGRTDLDVLFLPGDEDAVHAALVERGFVRFRAPSHHSYQGILDYISVNPANGYLLHVHAHFGLIIGESGVKSFSLPWVEQYISSARPDPGTGVFVANAAEELLLLLIRAAIKKRFPTPLPRPGRRRSSPSKDDHREFQWLADRVDRDELRSVAMDRLGEASTAAVLRVYDEGLSADRLDDFLKVSDERLASFRTRGKLSALCVRWYRRLLGLGLRAISRFELASVSKRRVAEEGGVVVAVMGPDGAGKSTLLANLKRQLSKKIDIEPIYLGSGKGPSSIWRWPLKKLQGLAIRARRRGRAGTRTPSQKRRSRPSMPRRFFKLLWAVTVAIEKKNRLRHADNARRRGFVVICDRFPQAEIFGFNDGPLLTEYLDSGSRLMRRLAGWELRMYERARLQSPDLVFKLVADPKILQARRPVMDVETIEKKLDGILKITFPERTKVIHLDATASPEDLCKEATIAILSSLRLVRPKGVSCQK